MATRKRNRVRTGAVDPQLAQEAEDHAKALAAEQDESEDEQDDESEDEPEDEESEGEESEDGDDEGDEDVHTESAIIEVTDPDEKLEELEDPVDPAELDSYVRQQENLAQLHGAVVVEVSHPQGREGIYDGRDGGIRMTQGAVKTRWSDGSTH